MNHPSALTGLMDEHEPTGKKALQSLQRLAFPKACHRAQFLNGHPTVDPRQNKCISAVELRRCGVDIEVPSGNILPGTEILVCHNPSLRLAHDRRVGDRASLFPRAALEIRLVLPEWQPPHSFLSRCRSRGN